MSLFLISCWNPSKEKIRLKLKLYVVCMLNTSLIFPQKPEKGWLLPPSYHYGLLWLVIQESTSSVSLYVEFCLSQYIKICYKLKTINGSLYLELQSRLAFLLYVVFSLMAKIELFGHMSYVPHMPYDKL